MAGGRVAGGRVVGGRVAGGKVVVGSGAPEEVTDGRGEGGRERYMYLVGQCDREHDPQTLQSTLPVSEYKCTCTLATINLCYSTQLTTVKRPQQR